MKANYLVCYDIRDSGRLRRVYKLLKGRARHIQYSVFHCPMTWTDLLELKERLKALIDENEDDVRIYPLPYKEKVVVMGCGDRVPDGVEIFID